MKQQAIATMVALAAGVTVNLQGAVPDIDDGFEGYPLGTTFLAPTGGWSSADAAVSVTNDQRHSGSHAAVLSENTALTNTVNAGSTYAVWTDFWIRPGAGVLPANAPTDTASFVSGFDTNGYVLVAMTNGWRTCSNDVWGGPVAPVLTNFIHLSVYQDYAASNMAVFVNGLLVLQDVRLGGSGIYGRLAVNNRDDSAWLDDVWVKTNYNGATLVLDRNGVNGPDALEVQTYGYAARILYVGGSSGYPLFATLPDALAVCRRRDTVYVNDGSFAGVLSVTQDVVLTGAALTNLAGISVASGASLTLNQSANAGSLSVTGSLYVATGSVLACQSSAVNGGVVTVGPAATFSNAALSVSAGGVVHISATNAHFISQLDGVDAAGIFDIGDTWPGAAAMPLPFADDFERYAAGSPVTGLGFAGWGSSGTNASIVTGHDHTLAGAGKSLELQPVSSVSNRIASSAGRVWTDFYLLANRGAVPADAPVSASTFSACVDTNGWLVVATSNSWVTCSNYYDNTAAVPLSTSALSRVTVFQDLTNHQFSVFVEGKLLREQLPFPSGSGVSVYGRLVVRNLDGTAYVDDLEIKTSLPSNLPGDLDGDGIPDAAEIDRYGMLEARPLGTVFRMR